MSMLKIYFSDILLATQDKTKLNISAIAVVEEARIKVSDWVAAVPQKQKRYHPKSILP
ncbi:hypothetical protein Lepto7376_2182 [[Leptolyngbya] sp. PCC 7376]|nr:hypothetical protein Lepto7376_2182 [[Leptolyngbya] sp. PCC 7376]